MEEKTASKKSDSAQRDAKRKVRRRAARRKREVELEPRWQRLCDQATD